MCYQSIHYISYWSSFLYHAIAHAGKIRWHLYTEALGGVPILGFRTTSMGNSKFKKRLPTNSLLFNMEFPILVKRNPNIATQPW